MEEERKIKGSRELRERKKEKWIVREKGRGKRNDVVNLKSCFYNVQHFFKKIQFNVSNSNFDNNSF